MEALESMHQRATYELYSNVLLVGIFYTFCCYQPVQRVKYVISTQPLMEFVILLVSMMIVYFDQPCYVIAVN